MLLLLLLLNLRDHKFRGALICHAFTCEGDCLEEESSCVPEMNDLSWETGEDFKDKNSTDPSDTNILTSEYGLCDDTGRSLIALAVERNN